MTEVNSILGILASDLLEAKKRYCETASSFTEWRKENPSLKTSKTTTYGHARRLQYQWGVRCATKSRLDTLTRSFKTALISLGLYTPGTYSIEEEDDDGVLSMNYYPEELNDLTDGLEELAVKYEAMRRKELDRILNPLHSIHA